MGTRRGSVILSPGPASDAFASSGRVDGPDCVEGETSRFAIPPGNCLCDSAYSTGSCPESRSFLDVFSRACPHTVGQDDRTQRASSWSAPEPAQTFPTACAGRSGNEAHRPDIGNTPQSRRCTAPGRDHPVKPQVEHIVQVQVAQQNADRPLLVGFLPRWDAIPHLPKRRPSTIVESG